MSRRWLGLLLLTAALRIPAHGQPDNTEAQLRAAIQAGVFVAGEEQRLTAYRNQKHPDPELLAKGEKETAALVARMHAKWAATPYLKLYQTALQKTLDDPTFRDRALQELDSPPGRSPYSSNPPPTAPRPVSAEDSVDQFFKTWTMPFVIGLVVLGIGFGFYLEKIGWKSGKKPYFSVPAKEQPSTTYGSAEWEEPRVGLPDRMAVISGVFFGKSSAPIPAHMKPWEYNPGAPVFSTPENNCLIVARARTGKGTRVIIPTLLRYFAGSAVVVDPKGENAAVTARTRISPGPGIPGQAVHIINPWGELASDFQKLGLSFATYNPLDVLDRNDPNVVATARDLAAAICPKAEAGKEPYWINASRDIVAAVLLWLTDQPGETKTLGRLRDITTRMDFRKSYLSKMAGTRPSPNFGNSIAQFSGPFISMDEKTYSNVIGSLATFTSFLSDPQIVAATDTSSFSMSDLCRKVTTVYLVIPPHMMDTQGTWLRLLISAGMKVYKRKRVKDPYRCLFLIDEFPALGRVEEIPRDIATMAGYGVDLVLAIQGLDQLKSAYGKDAGTILSNCAYKWFCNLDDLESAEYLSKTLGNKTVQTIGHGVSQGQNPGGGSSGTSTNYGETGRALMTPDELLYLGRDAAILLAPGSKPQYLRPVDYWLIPEAFASLREAYPDMYWGRMPLKWDENPLPH